jgi:hypothetical protein
MCYSGLGKETSGQIKTLSVGLIIISLADCAYHQCQYEAIFIKTRRLVFFAPPKNVTWLTYMFVLNGTVSRDFRPLVFFNKQSHLGPSFTS